MDLAGMKRRELQALCKRHGLSAGGTNADLVSRLDAALSGTAGAEEVAGVAARKGCLKQTGGDAAEAKKVTFAAEEGKARRLRSRVIWLPVVGKKTRGKSAQASTDSAAAEDDSISAEASVDVPVRRSRRNSVSAVEAEEVGEAVAVARKRKRKNQENDEGVAVSAQVAQVGVSSRVTRRSSLAVAAAVLPPPVEKKRGRGRPASGRSKLAAQAQDCEPDVQNSAQVEVWARITRSRATAPVVMSPTVVENKRMRKTGDSRTNVELPTVSDVPRNDASVTRSLRNRVVQDNNSMVGETHTARQLESKAQPSRPPTRRHQQVSSSVEDKNQEQITAPNKAPLLRRSGRNHSEDTEKQPEVKEPVKRSTCKSIVLATLEKEENGIIEEKNPETHVRRSMRKSIVPVKDTEGIGEKVHNANSEDAAKQPATKGPVRGSKRKSVVPELLEKEKGPIAEKNMEAHEGRSMRKPVMPVKDIKAVGKGIQNAKGKGVEKQFVVNQPTRRSSRKSVLPDMLENSSGLLAAEMNAEMNVRRSTQKSVLPNMLNEDNQDHSRMSRKENFHSGKCQDDERQQKVKEPVRRSRRSVAVVPLEEQSNGIHEEKMSKNPTRRSTRKSVALNEVEKVSMDHTEIVAQEPERVGEESLKLRKHRRSSLEISSSANDSWRKQQNAQISNEKDNTGGTQQALNSTPSKGRSSKRRRTAAPEEVMSVNEANDGVIIREATKDAHKATHEYNDESNSEVQEVCQVNATREEFSSGPLLVTAALTDEVCTVQSVPVVIPGSESGDNANESLDKSKQPQEHSDTQTVDSHLSETRSVKLDQSTCIAGLVPHHCVVSEDKALMSEDGLSIDFTVGDLEDQSPVSGEGRVGLEANASELGEKNLANVMSTGLHAKSLQHDTDIIAEGNNKDLLSMAFPIEEHGEKYAVSSVAVERSIGFEASGCESSGKPLIGFFSNDLHTKHRQHDCDVLTKDAGEASGAALPISESDNNREILCNAEESIRAADLGNCPSRGSKGNPYSTNLHLEGAAADFILPVLNADKGCSSDGRPSSFGLELLFAEGCKESKNIENTAVEVDGGDKPTTPVTPGFCVGLEDEDMQPTGCDADKNLDVQGSAGEENTAVEIDGGNKPSTPVTPGFCVGSVCLEDEDMQPTGCDADKNLDVEGIPGEENTAVEFDGGNKPSTPVTPGFYVGSDCLESVTEEVLAEEKCNDQHVPSMTNLKMKLNDELGPGMESVCITEKNIKFVAENLDQQAVIQVQQGDVQEGDLEKPTICSATPESKHECGFPEKNTSVEIDGGNKPRAPRTPGFYVGSDCLEDEDVQPTGCDGDKKVDVDQSVGVAGEENIDVTPGFYCLEDEDMQPTRCDADKEFDVNQGVVQEVLAQEKCNDQHVSAKTDLKMKLNNELAGAGMESGCSITKKNERLVADNLDQEGDLEKPSLCSATPDCKHECLLSKDTGSLPSAEQSPFGLDSLFSQEIIDESVGHAALASATAHTENGFDDSKDCHVKSALENALVSKPFSHHDTEGAISKNIDCTNTSQQDNGMEGLPEANPNEEQVLSVFSLDAKHITEVINSEEVAGEGEGSKELLHSEDLKASSEKTDVNGTDGNTNDIIEDASAKYIESGVVLLPHEERSNLKDGQLNAKMVGTNVVEFGLYLNKNIGNILDSGSVGEITPSGSGLSKDSSLEYGQEVLDGFSIGTSLDGSSICGKQNVCRVDAIENPSISLATTGYKHEGALSEEAGCTMKNYAGTYSSNPRELIMELQSRSVENSADESISVEQRVKVDHGSNLSQLASTDLLDEPVGCSNTDEQLSEPCTNDIAETAAAAKYVENEVVLLPSEERSNLNDEQLNPKLDSPNIMGSGLNCDKDVRKTSDNGSVFAIVGKRTPGSGLAEDYSKDHYPQQELLDGFSVEPSLQGNIFGKTIVSGVTGNGIPSLSLATPDYKHEAALSEEALCRTKNYTGTCSVDPRHLVMDLQSLCSEDSTEKSDLQDNLAFSCAERGRDEPIICHAEKLVDTHASSEPGTYQAPCEDLGRHEDKESCISLPMQANESGGICQPRSQKYIVEANSRLLSCDTELLHQDHKDECDEHNEDKFSPKALVESNMSEEGSIEGMERAIILPSVAGTPGMPDELLNTKMSDESEEELSFSCDKDTTENFLTGSAKRDLYRLPKDSHIDPCQKQKAPEALSLPGSGPCQQYVNESTSMQAAYYTEVLNQDHEEYNQNNEDQVTSGISASVPEAVEIEVEQSEIEIGLIPATETIVLPVPDEQPNTKLEGNKDQLTLGIPASSVPEAVEIEQSKMEIGLIHAAETSVLSVPDEQPNSKLEGNEVDEHSFSYDKDLSILFDSESLKREDKDDCMDLSSEDNHPNDLPAPKSPEQSAYFQNDNDSGSVGICQSSRQTGIGELRAKLQSFKVSSTVKGSYIAMSAPRPKPGDTMSQSAIALLRNIENRTAVKAGHPVKPNADGKDSSRRALQPISGRPREH